MCQQSDSTVTKALGHTVHGVEGHGASGIVSITGQNLISPHKDNRLDQVGCACHDFSRVSFDPDAQNGYM